MFERIVLAVDRWDQAKGAAAAAVDLATKSRGEVLVVHVHDVGLPSPETLESETPFDARLLAEAALEMVTRAGVKARSELRAARSTDVAKEILQGARDFGADTIVLGSRGLGDLTGMLLGGVAHRVIQLADCPVVVVRAVEATAASRDRDRGRAATVA